MEKRSTKCRQCRFSGHWHVTFRAKWIISFVPRGNTRGATVRQSNFVLKLANGLCLIIAYGHERKVSAGFERAHDDPRAQRLHTNAVAGKRGSYACGAFKTECCGVNIKMIRKRSHGETVRTTITEDLGGTLMCARFCSSFTYSRLPEKKTLVAACRDFFEMPAKHPELFDNIFTGRQSRCFTYDPKTIRQNGFWTGPECV